MRIHKRTGRAIRLVGCLAAACLAGCAGVPVEKTPAARSSVVDLSADPGYRPVEDPPRPASVPARTPADLGAHMRADAPMRYVVRPGDTLWDIASRYLADPWYWPALWRANPDIADPDRIYPGDVLVLSRGIDGRPRLRRSTHEVKLSPRVRVLSQEASIPTLPAESIRVFLDSPHRIDRARAQAAPYVVSLSDQQLVAGSNTTLYVRGLPTDATDAYRLVRLGDVYRDPDTGTVLGREALPIGEVTIDRSPAANGIALATLHDAQREARPGDRLLQTDDTDLVRDFHPRTPAVPVAARIVSVYGGISQIGQYDVVALADDRTPRLSRGDVLDIYQHGRTVADPVAGGEVRLPEQRAGRLMVFRNDGAISYALVMHASRAIHVGDMARSPADE